MNLGVWIVPTLLVAVFLFLWGAAWFENRFAPIGENHDLRILDTVDTALTDTVTDQVSVGVDDQLGAEPNRPAA